MPTRTACCSTRPTWLAWVLPPAYGFKLHYVLHFFLLAAGAFLLARLLAVGGVEYALLRHWEPKPDTRFALVGTFPNETRFPVNAYRVMDALPRAYLIAPHKAELLPADLSGLVRLASDEFDLSTQVILESDAGNAH